MSSQQTLLDLIYRQPGITQRELCEITGFNHVFIRRELLQPLMESGEIVETRSVLDGREVAYLQGV